MSIPKNNLPDILRRTKDLAGCPSEIPTSRPTSQEKISKFKPPKTTTPSGPVRQPHTGYLSFSTPGFRDIKNHDHTAVPVASSSNLNLFPSLLPSKRSSDPSVVSALSGAQVKRTKLKHLDEENNILGENSVAQHTTDSSISYGKREALSHTKVIDVDGDLVQPGARVIPAIDFRTDSIDELQLRLEENICLRDFLEEQLRNGCRDKESMRAHLDTCLDRICDLVKEQSVKRRKAPYVQTVQSTDVSHRPNSSDKLSENVRVKNTSSSSQSQRPDTYHADGKSKTNPIPIPSDDEDDTWRNFSDIDFEDIDFNCSTTVTDQPSSNSLNSGLQTSGPYSSEVFSVLKNTFSLSSFRQNQLQAITAALDGKDVFVLMPTGGGKSLCYQVPAVCKSGKTKGVTFIISPLIALMADQVGALRRKGIDAVRITSETNQQEYFQIRDRLLGTGSKPAMVYIAPERLQSNDTFNSWLQTLYSSGQLARFVIDEAHCVSTWGRDFRDAYKDLCRLRQNFPNVPIMALTATANQQVREDVINRLGIHGCSLFQQSFNRPNLNYEVRPKNKKIVSEIAAWITENHAGHTGVIYARTKVQCEKVAEDLREQYRLSAEYYHSDIDPFTKQKRLDDWMDGTTKIVVATIAFGMGVDKADVRFVIHHTLPKSFDSYYQETGRAGRDGLPADCILYFNKGDPVQISKLIEKDDTPRNERQRQLDALNEVERFCWNDTDCRRKQILHHFDQDFNPQECRKLCDVCAKGEVLVEEDVTQPALDILHLTRDLSSGGEYVTKTNVLAVYRGSRMKDIKSKGYDSNKLFGAGRGMPNDKIDRLFGHLLCEKGLAYQNVRTAGDWSSQYLMLGPNAAEFFNGRPLKMKFRVLSESSGSFRAPSIQRKPRKVKSPAPKAQPATNSTAFDDFDEFYAQDSDRGDNDLADDIEMSPPPRPQLLSSKRSKFGSPSGNGDDLIRQCLQELKEVRSNVAAEHALPDLADLIGDEALECLSLMGAEDMDQLKTVLTDCDVDAKKVVKLCGKRFLVVCQRYHFPKLQIKELHDRYDFNKSGR